MRSPGLRLVTVLMSLLIAQIGATEPLWLQSGPDQQELAQQLRVQLTDFAGDTQVQAPPDEIVQMCGIDAGCLQQAAAQLGHHELLLLTRSADATTPLLTLFSVADPQAKRQAVLPASADADSTLERAVRLWRPERHTGVLELSGLQVFDKLFIDGQEVRVEVPVSRHVLSVGDHQVELFKVGDESRRETLTVVFMQTVTLKSSEMLSPDLGSRPSPSRAAAFELPDWLGTALLGAGAAGMVLATGLGIHVATVIEPQRSWLRPQVEAGAVCLDGSRCFAGQLDALDRQSSIETSVLVASGLTGLVAAAAGTTLLILTDDQPVY